MFDLWIIFFEDEKTVSGLEDEVWVWNMFMIRGNLKLGLGEIAIACLCCACAWLTSVNKDRWRSNQQINWAWWFGSFFFFFFFIFLTAISVSLMDCIFGPIDLFTLIYVFLVGSFFLVKKHLKTMIICEWKLLVFVLFCRRKGSVVLCILFLLH